jgi:MFS family permease
MSTSPRITCYGSILWLLAALFFLYEFFLRTFVGSLSHQIIPDLHLTPETFALLGSAYYFAYGIMQVPVGMLADKFGVRRVLTFAALVCGLATFLFIHADNFYMALFARLLMGLGSSFAFVCLLIVTLTWFPQRYFAFFAGLSQFVGTIGPILAGGPLVVFLARSHYSWQTVFFYVALIGIALAILIAVIYKDSSSERTTEQSKPTITFKRRLLSLLQNKQAWFIALFTGTVYCSIALLGAIWGTSYLEARGIPQTTAASIISLTWLCYAIGCPLLGAASDLMRRRKPVMVFSALLGFFATCAITYLPTQPVLVYSLLFGALGVAASGQNVAFALITEHVSKSNRATALGLNNGMISVFDTLAAPIVGLFIGLSAGRETGHLEAHDFYIGFTIMPALYVVAFVIAAFFVKETYCEPYVRPKILNQSMN